MSDPFKMAPDKLRNAYVVVQIVSWSLVSIVVSEFLPLSWQFQNWPAGLQVFSLLLLGLFILAELVHMLWFFTNDEAGDGRK